MTCSWPTVTLDECASFQEGYVNPTQKKEHYFDGPVKWLRAVDLNNGSIRNTSRTLSEEGFKSAGKSALLFEPGTLAISKSGTIGRIGILEDYMCGNRAVINIKVDKDKCDNLYIFYVLLMSRRVIETLAVGSVQKNLYTSALGSLELRLPPLQVQAAIAKQLSDLDKKIDLNTQTNQTLEEMAQAIFKSWFVDFDPVKAKMNGKQPEGMDAATASLFPEKLVESELGLIPEGWDAVQVGDIVQRLKPKKRYTKKQVEPYGKTPVYEQGASILLGFHNDDAGFDASPEDPVFIFGDHTCITHLSCSKFDISSNVIPLKGSVRPTIWTYYAIQGKQEFQEYRRHWSEFIIKDVVLPPVELAEKYAELVTTKYLMMESLKRQSKELEQLRDTLLPKLLSGEIELAEKQEN
ncbi:restriction endonuclease subunit S [Shewanella oncorhynchi]|uniref:restriction endonuclease subunit S n=1 Tax=Shewanella oncorhynchi TaxID=2726434 RepID=UPI003D7BA4B0